MIVSADGYLLTNNHVVGDVNAQVSVVLGDKREMPAKIVGVDEWTDIAVLKIDARACRSCPGATPRSSKSPSGCSPIGNPFQLNQTVTLGIVSATGRSLEGRLATYEDFIQTDAAINPGNSGGALINARGELVGINTAIYSESGGYQGIGFAVPSNLARHVMDDLIKYGEVRRGTIPGIKVQPMTTQIAQQLGAPNDPRRAVYSDRPAVATPIAPASCPATSSSASTAPRSRTRRSSSACSRMRQSASIGERSASSAGRPHDACHGRRDAGHRPDQPPAARTRTAAAAATSRRRAAGRCPDTASLSAALHRHSFSTPTLIPIRRLHVDGARRQAAILDPQRAAGQIHADSAGA